MTRPSDPQVVGIYAQCVKSAERKNLRVSVGTSEFTCRDQFNNVVCFAPTIMELRAQIRDYIVPESVKIAKDVAGSGKRTGRSIKQYVQRDRRNKGQDYDE